MRHMSAHERTEAYDLETIYAANARLLALSPIVYETNLYSDYSLH